MNLPDFFIPGAPKAGTTSLYFYLRTHPQIFMPRIKESWFFSFMNNPQEFESPNKFTGVKYFIGDYAKRYDSAMDGQICGDASPSYLYTYQTTIANLKRVYRDPDQYNRLKFIIILRNPTDRAWSQYWTFQRRQEDPLDFQTAMQSETIQLRLAKNWQPFYDYVGFGMYFHQVKAYLDEFGKQSVKIFLFEDLQEDPSRVCKDIFQFLEVDSRFQPEHYPRFNPSGEPRNRWLINFLLMPGKLKNALKPFIPWHMRQQMKNWLGRRMIKKMTLPDNIRQELIEIYKDDIRQLEKLIHRDLSNWLKR